jgi:SAM-dependent methyltransferase
MGLLKKTIFSHNGYCPICENTASFTAKESWFRDNLFCSACGSIPRERALMKVISDFYPNWRDLVMHESSPGDRGASTKLRREFENYTSSHFYPNIKGGQVNTNSGYHFENIEKRTFPDNSFDLFITQDVMEHIFDAEEAFKEISRVIRPGRAHIFTVPLINKVKKSERWASRSEDGEIIYHHPAEYHGNPVDSKGALVTMHYGYDIVNFITQATNMPTVIIMIDNIDLGIRAEYIDVLLSVK